VFDEVKLDYLNGHYLRQKSVAELVELARPYLEKAGYKTAGRPLEKFIALARERMKKLSDGPELIGFLFALPPFEPELLRWKTLSLEQTKNNLRELKAELEKIPEGKWQKDHLEKTILAWIKEGKRQNGDYLWPLRVALTGLKNSPGPFEVADALGSEESFTRLNNSLK